MRTLNWVLAVKRLYLTLWAFGVAAGVGAMLINIYDGKPLFPMLSSVIAVFLIFPAIVFVASRWIFKGLNTAQED